MKLESVTMIDIHVFGDSGILGSCAAAYATVYQWSSLNQALILSKSRLFKRELTIPRLELIAICMAGNLATITKNPLQKLNIRSIIRWKNSAEVLHCKHINI